MIIRSQDKEIALNFNQVVYFRVAKRINKECDVAALYSPFSENDCGFVSLGEYSSKEKAIKVLDMIEKEYGKHFYGQGGALTTANFYVPPFAFIPPKVFQMPQDNEVEV